MNNPIKLLFENTEVATINNFSYETPWASGHVEFIEKIFHDKLVKVTSMLSFDQEMDELGLEDEEEEKLYNEKLSELGLIWEDLKLDRDERWGIEKKGSRKQKIYAVRFYQNGSVEWRL